MAGKPRYTKALMEALYKLYDGNFTKMARSINAPRGSIGKACKRYGLKNKRSDYRKKYIWPKTEAYIRTVQLLPTMNDVMISKEVTISRERVRQIRNEHGISSPFYKKYCSPSWTEEKIAKLVSLNPEEHTIDEAITLLNVGRGVLRNKMKELGIKHFKYINKAKYSEEFIRELYDKHNGNISKMAVEVRVQPPSMARQCYKYGLRGQGVHEGNNAGKRKGKYHYDRTVRRLWKKYNGVAYQIAKNSDVPLGSVRNICKRLGLSKPTESEG